MMLGEVIGRVWAERPLDGLAGRTLVQVQFGGKDNRLVALDQLGVGNGSKVLVVTGEPARHIAGGIPVDAVIVAIVKHDEAATGRKGAS